MQIGFIFHLQPCHSLLPPSPSFSYTNQPPTEGSLRRWSVPSSPPLPRYHRHYHGLLFGHSTREGECSTREGRWCCDRSLLPLLCPLPKFTDHHRAPPRPRRTTPPKLCLRPCHCPGIVVPRERRSKWAGGRARVMGLSGHRILMMPSRPPPVPVVHEMVMMRVPTHLPYCHLLLGSMTLLLLSSLLWFTRGRKGGRYEGEDDYVVALCVEGEDAGEGALVLVLGLGG